MSSNTLANGDRFTVNDEGGAVFCSACCTSFTRLVLWP